MRLTEENAARLVFDDNKTDAVGVIERLRALMEFLLWPAAELASDDLEFRNKLMANYVLASLLRIYTPDVWHVQWCHELREYVVSKGWESSKIKNSWAQTRKRLKKRRQKES